MEKGKADDDGDEEEDIGDEEEEKAKNWLELKAVKLSSWKSLQTEDVHQRAAARTASPGSSTPGGSSEAKAAGEALWAVIKDAKKKSKDEQDEGERDQDEAKTAEKGEAEDERILMTLTKRKRSRTTMRKRKPSTG